jgi:hypothetical protein
MIRETGHIGPFSTIWTGSINSSPGKIEKWALTVLLARIYFALAKKIGEIYWIGKCGLFEIFFPNGLLNSPVGI